MEVNKKCNCPLYKKRIVFDDPKNVHNFLTIACVKCGASYRDNKDLKGKLKIITKLEFVGYAKKFCKA